jgi:PAS domain S-box-containing protein
MMHVALDAIITMDSGGLITFWNTQSEKIFGWKGSEVLGKPFDEIIFPAHSRSRYTHALAMFQETGDAAYLSDGVETIAIRMDGTLLPVEITIKPFKQDSGIIFCTYIRDKTHDKKLASDLRHIELRFRSLIDQASDAIMITDDTGNFEDVNAGLCKMFGYNREDLLQKNINVLIDPEQIKHDPIRFDQLKKGIPTLRERRMIHKDGTIIEVEANVKILHDGRMLAIARDITERKKSEKALRESELRFRNIAEHAPMAFACYLNTGEVVFVNPKFIELTGYDLSDIPTVEHFIKLALHDEKSRKWAKENWEIKTAAGSNSLHSFIIVEISIRSKLGVKRIVELTLTNHNERIYVIANDVTERKLTENALRLSEQKYKLLFNKNPLPLIMFSRKNLDILDVNESAILQYGYSREEFLSLSATDLRPFEEVGKFIQTLKSDEDRPHQGIWKHKRKDGSIILVEIIAHNIIYNEEPARLTLAHDVTEKLKAEESLRSSNELLRQLSSHLENVREEERTNIAREIHDELGQQLTGIKMDASWLLKKIPAGDQLMSPKISGIITLIDDMIGTIRRISSELRPVILDDLGLTDALDWQSAEFEKRTGIRCKFKPSLSEMNIKKNISNGIFRIYQETLTNAARHSMATEIKTTLLQLDDQVIFRVEDNGKGFDQSEIISKNTLGMVGMKERASMIGGSLLIESEREKGTIIELNIPLDLISEK